MEKLPEVRYKLSKNISPVPDEKDGEGWIEWLQAQAIEKGLLWLLVHQDDGIIWGRMDGKRLIFPHSMPSTFPVSLARFDPRYMQKLRLFSDAGELLVWRDMDKLAARFLLDQQDEGEVEPYIDRLLLLWGSKILAVKDGFTLLQEGEQGFYHAPPLDSAGITKTPAGVIVRHYLKAEPDTGQMVIHLSRLVGFQQEGGIQ